MRGIALLVLFAAGCDSAAVTPRPGDTPAPPRPELAAAHDPANCGRLGGRVAFAGPTPDVPKLLGALAEGEGYAWVTKPNPFTPRVNRDGGLADVLVWLDGVDPAKSKPWPRSDIAIDIVDTEFRSGGEPFVVGVARTGDVLTVTSRDGAFHSLRARGAAFFALPFPARDSAVSRELPRPGVVELTDATTAYWVAADVFVSDTPYAEVTDHNGRYNFDGVPAGEYALHFRARNWKVTRTERDPETGLHARQYYAPPATKSARVTIRPGDTIDRPATFAPADFSDSE